ncbi:hypothetical protein GGTG_13549 [Gaeumannomyces tritici R3-111a-1]|uniref:Uncharacterized protein n=1 Tax=Gaeumannomyces tritici (strain R3-111a-1) TaxID=644352 RepID=J3PJ67_GAET3|nr:hypothetical protein GGTG_13549 [Gaeumannomyces tritici R3-111a-1]EJT68885.1 hypothetical protein GGTG_13549 [Gaeumannomyces tritici R3-111a-1]
MATQLFGGQVLSLSTDEHLSDNTQNGSPQIQNLTGGDNVSETKRGLLAQHLLQAPSIDATALTALLDRIPSESDHRPVQSYYPSPSRSSTVELPEDEEHEYEIKCYQALFNDNCQPLFHVDLLPHIEANPDAHAHLLRPWTTQQHPADAKGKWQALSRQWNRWKEFRAWQLRGRHRRPGFGEYLDVYRRDYFMSGGTSRRAAELGFEQTARLRWERDYGDYGEDEEDVEGHAEVVRKLLPQGFVIRRPLRLLPDPKTQDLWITYVEYLAFEAECLYLLAGDARRLEKRAKGKYEVAKAKVDQQQCRVDWVLSEIEKIKEEQKAAAGEGSSGKTGSSKKRRPADDTDGLQDVVEPRLGKRRRMGKTDEDTTDKDKTDETEVLASRSNYLSQKRRSKRRKPSTDEQEEKDVPEPRSKRREVASMSDGPGSVLQASGAPAVPAVTTIHTSSSPRRRQPKRMTTPSRVTAAAAPEPRGERIKTLRPRVNGKAATISTLTDSRRHGAARRPRGGLRVAAGSMS